jgi:hypothetical protein
MVKKEIQLRRRKKEEDHKEKGDGEARGNSTRRGRIL